MCVLFLAQVDVPRLRCLNALRHRLNDNRLRGRRRDFVPVAVEQLVILLVEAGRVLLAIRASAIEFAHAQSIGSLSALNGLPGATDCVLPPRLPHFWSMPSSSSIGSLPVMLAML